MTVNAALRIGALAETVTVSETPVAVKFNSTTMETTLDTKMVNELPIIHRNPFLLATLDPAVNYRGRAGEQPVPPLGGQSARCRRQYRAQEQRAARRCPATSGSQGQPTCPAVDAVSEVNVQQNATDSEFAAHPRAVWCRSR